MALRWLAVCLLVACGVTVAGAAHAQSRLAFVVGNDNYQNIPSLKKAVNDARSTAATMRKLNFKVTLGENLSRRDFNERFSTFEGSVSPGDTVFLFYSGHGVEMDGSNYLVPVDAPRARQESLLKSESVSTNNIIQILKARGARTVIMVLDACRDDPFKDANGRSLPGARSVGGLGPPPGTDIFIVYSAGNGEVALDRLSDNDPNPNSVFTRSFLPLLEDSNRSLLDVVKTTRDRVQDLARSVGHSQFLSFYDQIRGDIFLAKGVVVVPAPQPAPPPIIVPAPAPAPAPPPRQPPVANIPPPPPPPPPPPAQTSTLWDHNNSVMLVKQSGGRVSIYYQVPRQGMIDEGVRSGTLLFDGQRVGDRLSGTAYVFDRRCGSLPYQDDGEIFGDRKIILNGRRVPTQLTSDCRVAGYRVDTSVFSKRD